MLSSISRRELIRKFKAIGFEGPFSGGKHQFMIDEHERKGIYYRPSINWTDTFQCASDLSKKHTAAMGSPSPDVIHIASALMMKAERFLSFDERQTQLAHIAGLSLEKCA